MKTRFFAFIVLLSMVLGCKDDEDTTKPVTGVNLDKTEVTMLYGATEQLTATITPSDATDNVVSWSVENSSIVTVSEEGLLTAVGAGTTTVTVTTNQGNFSDECEVTVVKQVNGISLNKTSVTLNLGGETLQLIAKIEPLDASNKSINWETEDNNVVTVSDEGLLTAIGVGTTTVIAKTVDGEFTASCGVTVVQGVTGVAFEKSDISLFVGIKGQLYATVTPEDASNKTVTWKSDDSNIVSVSSTGLLSAVNKGNATITVKTSDGGYTATCVVYVTEDLVPVMTSNTTPSGTVASSGTIANFPYRVFDDPATNYSYWVSSSLPAWISYTFEEKKIINVYYVLPQISNELLREPVNFQLQGRVESTDAFVVLDEREGESFTSRGSVFEFNNESTGYKTYRLYVTTTRGNKVLGMFDMRLGYVSE